MELPVLIKTMIEDLRLSAELHDKEAEARWTKPQVQQYLRGRADGLRNTADRLCGIIR